MSTQSITTGNLLNDPTQESVKVGNETRKITRLSVMSDFYRFDEQSQRNVQDEEKTYPVRVTIWNEHLGDQVAKVLRKGMRVHVSGFQEVNAWLDKDGKARTDVQINADTVTLMLNRVEEIRLRPKETRENSESSASDRKAA